MCYMYNIFDLEWSGQVYVKANLKFLNGNQLSYYILLLCRDISQTVAGVESYLNYKTTTKDFFNGYS